MLLSREQMNRPHKAFRRRPLTTIILGLVWIVAVAAGLRTLMSYENAPGPVGVVHRIWPKASKIPRPSERAMLVMVAHPRCPCTDASMEELSKIMAHVQGKVSAYVVFSKPKGASLAWEDTELRRSAAKIRGVTVLADDDGIEARRLGAETSGHTFLYGRDGRLLFSGGITQSRGHAGDNSGESAIISLINNHRAARTNAFVFGCPLVDRNHSQEKGLCLK